MYKKIDLKVSTRNKITVQLVVSLVLLLVCSSLFAKSLLERQRTLYVEAEQALRQGQHTLFMRHLNSLRDYPLYPYLLYADRARRIAHVKPEIIIDFLSRYDKTPLADKLRYKWLKHLAATNNHQLLAQHYRRSAYYADKKLACFYAQSLLQLHRFDELRVLVRKLWLVHFSQPPECDAVFLWGKKKQIIDQDLIWQRILLLVQSGDIKLADYLARQLDADTRTWYNLLKESYYRPFETLEKIQSYPTQSPFLHKVLLQSLSRARSQDLNKAHAIWQDIKSRFRPYSSVYEQVAKELGIAACRKLEPEIALMHLSSLSNSDNDKDLYHWRIRCALLLQRWDTVLETVASMDEQESADTRWLYWKARALESIGKKEEAIAIWNSIASEASYYSYLAADKVGEPYSLSMELPEVEDRVLNEIANTATMKRVYEFFSLRRIFDARRELFYWLPQLSGDKRLGVALLCRRWRQATCAIEALADPIFWHKELELRFPMPHRDIVDEEARRSDLSAHWIYAVIRRESAFIEDVKSSAGALGLMQLMPATASRSAKNLGLSYSSTRALLQPVLNMRLGSYYLKSMYTLNGRDWPSALASYNAGPHRVKQWKSQISIDDSDIWIETIPFTETRRYTRAVLFYAVVYYYKIYREELRLRTLGIGATHKPP